ncbi:MAG: glycosyltransferase [Patescibacteria group bacterium]|jgi:GT2 family glycosyltransferase
MHVSLCITTWNDVGYLPNLFASIHAQTHKDITIRMFDNGSSDGETVQYILKNEPHWLVVRSTRYVGAAVARNQLIRIALERFHDDQSSHVVIFTESGMVLQPDMIANLLRTFEENPDIDLLQPKILRAFSERGDGDTDAVQSDIIDTTGRVILPWWRFADRGAGDMDRGQYDMNTDDILSASGILCMRARVLESLLYEGKVFDDILSERMGEIDFALRCARSGFVTKFDPSAKAHRYRGFATDLHKTRWLRLQRSSPDFIFDYWLLLWKHLSFIACIQYLPRAIFLDLPRSVLERFFHSSHRKEFFLFPFFRMWKARRFLSQHSQISLAEIRRKFSLRVIH